MTVLNKQPKYNHSYVKENSNLHKIGFWGVNAENAEFSNFYYSPFDVVEDGLTKRFTSVEHYFMYCKAVEFSDTEIAKQLLKNQSGSGPQYKKLGRNVRNYNDSVWSQVRYEHMLNGLRYKFTSNPALKERLLLTGNSILVEASPFDSIWGIGMGKTTRNGRPLDWENVTHWRGSNLLGYALMELRDELR